MKNLKFLLEYGLIRIASWLVSIIPFQWALKMAVPIGAALFAILNRLRQRTIESLKCAFPEKSEDEIKSIAKGAFVHLVEFGIEWLRMSAMIKNPEKYLIEVYHKEKIYAELEKKNGAIVLISHTGNWEIMALMGGLLVSKPIGGSVYAVARPLDNPYLYQYAVEQRGGQGLKTIDKSGGVRETFDRLKKENAIVCVLIDQRVSEGSVETQFFGRPALTTSLPIVAALRLNTPIFYNFLYRTKDLRYEMKVEGPISIERTGNFKKDIEVNTQKFVQRIEAEIRKQPSHWLWMHNRWRMAHGAKD